MNGGPRRVRVSPDEPAPEVLQAAADHVRSEGLLAYPTETVYGFGGRARGPALERLLQLKGRLADRPFLLLVPGIGEAEELRWTPEARRLAEAFWPGPLTLVLADPEGRYPPGVRSREGGVALRMSPHPVARRLLAALGEPLTSTSANAPGAPPALDAEAALRAARTLGAGPELLVLDGGALEPSPPSTIVDCAGTRVRVRREGALSRRRLAQVIPELE